MNVTKKLTKKFIENIKPHPSKETFVWDTEIKGFGVRVFPSGRKTYLIQYRNEFNRTKRKKIGLHGTITTEQAREQAKILTGSIAKGEDLSSVPKNKFLNVKDLSEKYLDLHAKVKKKESSYKDDKQRIDNIINPRFGDKRVEEVTPLDLMNLCKELKSTPYTANRLIALLSKMYSLAIQWGWAKENPTVSIEKYQEHKRTRWLDEEELDRLWKALDTYHNQNIANIYRLLLLTGSRKGEVLNATWDQFDLEKGIWTKPAHTTKQKRMEHLPLSSQVVELLKAMKASSKSKDYLFPGRVEGQPLKEIKNNWITIKKLAQIEDVRIHDLRHTHASHLVSKGFSLSIVGKLLGHTQTSTTQRYAHLADAPLRQAAEAFGQNLTQK